MKYIVVSVRDGAAGGFGRPAFVQSKGVAIRSFQDEVNRVDRENVMNQHPADFEMFVIGEFDDATGMLTPLPQPVSLARAIDLHSGGKRNVQE